MFSRLTRLSLRRGFHSASGHSNSSRVFSRPAKIIFGASGAAYIGYQLSTQNQLHLDSPQPSSTVLPKPQPKLQKSNTSQPPPTSDANTPDFIPDRAPVPDNALSSDADSAPQEESSSTEPEGEGEGAAAAANKGAYDPVTGEINWDCPCLGGMAHGPCGEEFKEAFSCFVYSEAEPKGINCVEKFQAMQNCFRAHPDAYADEIMRDDDDDDETNDAPTPSDDSQLPPQSTNDTIAPSDTESQPAPQVIPSTDSSVPSS
ncbi:hypothetical protein BJ165DRAFT_951827 [Panaeolus papilionaceus]|nr:hypothetical protein BJ165DRAFT_951827 [Panaeolus papilionaceus]